MFQIVLLHSNLNIWIRFLEYYFKFFQFFGFFSLFVRVRLITLQIRICFLTSYKIHSGISNISNRIWIRLFGSDYRYYAHDDSMNVFNGRFS